jgi:outer membrane protein assembly factor BamB
MKRILTATLALTIVALAVRADDRERLFSRPDVPPPEVLDRLNLKLRWRGFVPMDGRRDGFASIQVAGPDLLVQTRSGLVTVLDAETGKSRWRARVGRAYDAVFPMGYNSRSVLVYNNGLLYALDRATGRQQWTFRVPEGLSAPPVADEEIFFLCGATTHLYAYLFPALNEPEIAEKETEKPREAPPGGEKSRYLPGGVLEAGVREALRPGGSSPQPREGQYVPGTTIGAAVREALTEQIEGPQPIRYWDTVTNIRLELRPVLGRETILVASPSGTVVAFAKVPRSASGPTELFRFSADGDIVPPPASYGEMAYIGSQDANVYALDLADGTATWRFTAGTPVSRQPAATEKDLYVTSERNGMARLDRATGAELWRVPRGRGFVFANPDADRFIAANPKFVYAADRSGMLLILDRARGTKLSCLDVHDFAFPVTNDVSDRIYLAANDGLIICLNDREYARPFLHRKLEDTPGSSKPLTEADQMLKERLETTVTRLAGEPVPLKDLLKELSERYKVVINISDRAFTDQGLEAVSEKPVTFPNAEREPLRSVLQKILAQVNATFVTAGGTIQVVPAKPKEPGKEPGP